MSDDATAPNPTGPEGEKSIKEPEGGPADVAVDGDVVMRDSEPQSLDHIKEFLGRKHRATLLVYPSNAAAVWKNEISLHFPYLTRRYWFRSKNSGDSEDRALTLGASPGDLYLFLRSLPDKPMTRNTVVLTTYQTLRTRAIYIEVNGPSS